MTTHVHCGSDHRNLQIHGFHVQHKRVEIIREALHNIRDHHRLRTHRSGTFSEVPAIRQHENVPTTDLTDSFLEIGRCDNGLHEPSALVHPNRAHRNGMIIQLALLAQELQRLRNALRGTNHHSAIRICALFTAGQHKLADNQTLQHGNQECAQQHQAGMQQRYINVENRINCTNHQSREKRAFDQ